MRTAKFCVRNTELTDAGNVIEILRQNHKDDLEVRIVDCFRRCLECRVKPFCRIQLTTVEATDGETLVKKILETIQKK